MLRKLKEYKKHPASLILLILIYTASAVTVGVMVFVVGYILVKGIPNITFELFSLKYNSENVSMLPSMINTLTLTVMTLLIAAPVGFCSAVFLAEYSKRGSKFVRVIRLTTETLAGIPSIVYGLFGFLAFVVAAGSSYSLWAGVLTMAIMVLPTIMRTTEEALLSVPDSYREGSYGLGAGKLRTIVKVILPSAVPGILSGFILAIGRIVGETAALIFTAGSVPDIAASPTDSARTLAVHMYCLLSEGLYTDQAYATAVVLLVLVIGINALSGFAAKKLTAKQS